MKSTFNQDVTFLAVIDVLQFRTETAPYFVSFDLPVRHATVQVGIALARYSRFSALFWD